MKTHKRLVHFDMLARAVPSKRSRASERSERSSRAARRFFATALLLSLGMGALATSGYAISQVSAHGHASAGQVPNIPWMY